MAVPEALEGLQLSKARRPLGVLEVRVAELGKSLMPEALSGLMLGS